MGWRQHIYDSLNRPGLRFLLSGAGTVHATWRARRFCPVRYRRRAWVHRFPEAVLVEPGLISAFSDLESLCRDAWTYRYTPREGDVVLDIGAGTGWSTLFFSRLVGRRGCVFSIEAHPNTFSCLERTCSLNHVANVLLIEVAVAAVESDVFITDEVFHQTNTIMAGKGIRVHARSLDSILSPFRLGRIDFMKMNIEGAEALAITGMLETIRKTSHVAIQCHDFVGQCTKERIMEFLRLNGFQVETRRDNKRPYIRDTVYGSKAPCGPNVN